MAINAFTRKQSIPNSNEFLQKYDELLKRRKPGGVVSGYDTAGNMAMNMGGTIANPTGMSSQDKQKEIVYSPVDYSTTNPAEVDISQLSPEELSLFYSNPYIDDQTRGLIEQTLNELYSPETANVLDNANQNNQEVSNVIAKNEQDRQLGLNSQTPSLPPSMRTGSISKQGNMYTGEAVTTDEQLSQLPEELQLIAKVQRDNARFLQDAPKEYEQILREQQKQKQEETDSARRMAPRLEDIKAKESGLTTEQLNQNNNLELSLPAGYERSKDGSVIKTKTNDGKDYRGEVGDALDVLATFLHLPETGLSEKIAGRNTKNTITANAEEPIQSGQGISNIQKDFQPGVKSVQQNEVRPAVENINGFNPVIGNVAGIQGENSITGSNTPNQFSGTPITPASVARIAEGGSPITQNIGVGNNQPNNQQNNQSNNQNNNNANKTSNQTVSNIFKPVSTNKTISTTKSSTPTTSGVNVQNITSKTIPVSSNIGVGSNQPTQQSQPKQSIVSTVSNIIKNLFKRK